VTRFAASFPQPFPAPMRAGPPELPPLHSVHRDGADEWRVVERRDEYLTLRCGERERMMTRQHFADWRRRCEAA
jgi:hypothetical protein